jgi:hypothetical protein
MQGSTLLPWIFFGPLLASGVAYAISTVTQWQAAAIAAQVCGGIVLVVILAAFAANLLRGRP